MATSGTLLPILHEADWSGASLAACRPLVESSRDYVPLVAFAIDSTERRSIWTRAGLEDAARTLDDLAREADRNLAKREVAFRPKPDGTLVAIDEYASSLLASGRELDRARGAVGADAILLAAPTRGLLVVVPKPDAGDAGLSRFARETFASALEARITPHVFAWDGDSLAIFDEHVPAASTGRFIEVAYDEDAEELTLSLDGPLGPAALREVRRVLAAGETHDARPVAFVTLDVRDVESARVLASELPADDVRVRLSTDDDGVRPT